MEQQRQDQDIERPQKRFQYIPKLSADDRDEFGEQVVLAPEKEQPIFTGYTDNQLMFTSNTFLSRADKESDMLFISTTGFSIEPPLPEEWDKWTFSFFGRYQAYRYDDHDELNFHLYTGGLTAGYQIDDLWTVLFNNSYNIFYNEDSYDAFFKETDHQLTLYRNIPIDDQWGAFAGYQIQFRNTAPAHFSRVENDLFAGVRYAIDEKWMAQLYERLERQDYTQRGARKDWNILTVLSLTYYFNDWCNARIFGSYTQNDSNQDVADYNNFNGGGGVNLQVKF